MVNIKVIVLCRLRARPVDTASFMKYFFFSVFSIKCWNCRSNNDPKCADPFDNSTVPITDCDQEKGLQHLPGLRPSMCRKIRQKGN